MRNKKLGRNNSIQLLISLPDGRGHLCQKHWMDWMAPGRRKESQIDIRWVDWLGVILRETRKRMTNELPFLRPVTRGRMKWKEWREFRQEKRMIKTLEMQNDQVEREEIKEGIGDRIPFYVLKVRGLTKNIGRDDLVKALGEQDSLILTETKLVIKRKESKYNCAFVVYFRRLDYIKAWNVGKTWDVMAKK